jgi:hypothetical protein
VKQQMRGIANLVSTDVLIDTLQQYAPLGRLQAGQAQEVSSDTQYNVMGQVIGEV